MSTLAARSMRGALFLTLGTVSNIAIGFLGGIVLARVLAPNDFGTFALATTVYAFADLRIKLQLDQKFLRDQDTRPEFYDTFVSLNLVLSAISLVLLLAVALIAWLAFNRGDLGVTLAVLGVASLADTLSAALRLASEKLIAFGQVALFQTTVALLQFGVTLIAALAGLGLTSLLLGLSVSSGLNLILYWRNAPRRPRWRLDRPLVREFLSYGLRYGVVFATASVILTQFDTLSVGLISGTVAAGYYDRAYRTALWPTLIISASLARISLPTYSRLNDDLPRLRRAFSLVLWTVLTIVAPGALLFVLTGPDLVQTIYSERWLPSTSILQLLAAFALFRPLWDDLVSILLATHRSGQLVRLVSVQAVALIILALPLTYWFGGEGTAISVGLIFLISAGYLLYFGHTQLKVDLMANAAWPLMNCLLALVGFLVLRGLLPMTLWQPWQRLAVSAALLFGLYVVISLVTSRRYIASQVQFLWQALRG